MAYFATVAEDFTINGLYNDNIAPPPMDAIPLTDEQYLTIVSDIQRWTIIEGELVQNPAWVDPNSLESVRAVAQTTVNSAAGQLVQDLLRRQDGENLFVLIQKRLETGDYKRALANAEMIVPTDYPLLNAIAGSLSLTLEDVYNSALLQVNYWTSMAAPIEAERVRLYHAIEDAATVEDIQAALATANWP